MLGPFLSKDIWITVPRAYKKNMKYGDFYKRGAKIKGSKPYKYLGKRGWKYLICPDFFYERHLLRTDISKGKTDPVQNPENPFPNSTPIQ